MADKNIHMRIKMEVIGTEGLDLELKYSFTDLDTVKMIQKAVVEAIMSLNEK